MLIRARPEQRDQAAIAAAGLQGARRLAPARARRFQGSYRNLDHV